MTDEHDGIQHADDRQMPDEIERVRRAYVPPELVEYGTVAKLTQTGGGSFNDGGGMMMMMACL